MKVWPLLIAVTLSTWATVYQYLIQTKAMNLYRTLAIFIFSIVSLPVLRTVYLSKNSPPRGCRQVFCILYAHLRD